MENKQPKKYNTKPTLKQARATKIYVENRGKLSKGEAMIEAGYSPNSAKNPANLTRSKAFTQVLEEAGLTDEYLAKGHRELAEANTLKEMKFDHEVTEHLVAIDEEDPKYIKGGREKQFFTDKVYTPVSLQHIKKVISSIKGAVYVTSRKFKNDYTLVYYTVPDPQTRAKAQELSYKTKGHFAAERIEHTLPEATDEEKAAIKAIFGSNQNK